MRMTRFVRIQLIIFSILTVIGLVVMSIQYVKVPVLFGVGRYEVSVRLPSTGGLYSHANVAYRGTNIGVVENVTLTGDGVEAKMSLDSDYKIPADVDAVVKSVSAVGEQYVDLIPRDGAAEADGPYLANGDVIPLDRATIPQDVGEMLDQADELLASISDTRLQTVIDEAFTAFNGSGPDLQRLIDSARLFVEEADANSDATKALIDQVGPLLDTQTVSSDAIRSWTQDLVTFTDQLRASDPSLRSVLEKGPGTAQEATQLFQDLQPTLPILLRNLVSVGQVGGDLQQEHRAGSGHLPAPDRGARDGGDRRAGGGRRDRRLRAATARPAGLHDGIPAPPEQRRSGDQTDPIATPNDLYCKAAPDDPAVVRGARNLPCMEFPGRRAPTVEACREGWEASGNNPPYGPIMPPDVPRTQPFRVPTKASRVHRSRPCPTTRPPVASLVRMERRTPNRIWRCRERTRRGRR